MSLVELLGEPMLFNPELQAQVLPSMPHTLPNITRQAHYISIKQIPSESQECSWNEPTSVYILNGNQGAYNTQRSAYVAGHSPIALWALDTSVDMSFLSS